VAYLIVLFVASLMQFLGTSVRCTKTWIPHQPLDPSRTFSLRVNRFLLAVRVWCGSGDLNPDAPKSASPSIRCDLTHYAQLDWPQTRGFASFPSGPDLAGFPRDFLAVVDLSPCNRPCTGTRCASIGHVMIAAIDVTLDRRSNGERSFWRCCVRSSTPRSQRNRPDCAYTKADPPPPRWPQ